MSRAPNEIRDLVQDVETPFNVMRDQMRKEADQLYVHESYKAELIAALAPELDTRIALPSRRPQSVARDLVGILRQSLQFHVEPAGQRAMDDRRADKRELMYAHLWEADLNKGDRVLGPTYRLQTVSRGAIWWLDWNAFALPKEEAEREQYRHSYSPFKLSVYDFHTTAFLAADDGQPTIAVRRLKIPYHEVVTRYGKNKKDKAALQIMGEQFPWLRGGKGQSVEASDLYSKTAEVVVVDDGVTICHYIDLGADSAAGTDRYQTVFECPNPWGAVSAIVIPGEYNHDAEALEDRYRALIGAMLGEQRNVDVMDSHMASLALTPNKHVQQLDREVARQAVIEDKAIPGVEFNGEGFATAYGDVADIGTQLSPSVTEIRTHRAEDRDASLPSPFLTNPDPVLLKGTTAAGQLNAHETSNRSYDGARAHVIAGVVQVCKMIDHFICEGHLNKKGQPKEANEKIYIRATGNEPTSKYRGEDKGKEFEIGPEDYEPGDILEVTPVAMTESQKFRNFELKLMQYQAHIIPFEELIATVTEDVSGQKEKLEIERRYQQLGPMLDNADLLAMVEAIKLDSGGAMDLSFLLNPNNGPPSAIPPEGDVSDATGGGMNRTDPPATSTPAVGAMG